MLYSIFVLAQLSGGAEAIQGAGGIVVVGFLFAVIVLALLSALTAAMGAWFTKQAADSAAKAAASSQAVAEASKGASASLAAAGPSGPGNDEDDPATIAVIAAAVHTAIGDRSHRVVSIRSAGPGWAQEGRRQIFSSHRVR